MNKIFLNSGFTWIITMLLVPCTLLAQDTISGKIIENTENALPLPGANVYWLNTNVGAVTNFDGEFELSYKPEYKKLIISFDFFN